MAESFRSPNKEVKKFLEGDEKPRIIYRVRTDSGVKVYSNFLNQLTKFLDKLSVPLIKKYVGSIIDKKLIFLSHVKVSRTEKAYTFSSFALSKDKKLSGIFLDIAEFDISIETGDCGRIDDVIYAIYFSLIRASVISFFNEIKKDIRLHKMLIIYLFIAFMRTFSKGIIYSEKQKQLIYYMVIVAFYKRNFNYNIETINSLVASHYGDLIDVNLLKEFDKFQMKTLESYSDVLQIPKMLSDFSLITEKPAVILAKLISLFGPYGFQFLKNIDTLIAMIVVSQYPFEFIPSSAALNNSISSATEKHIVSYVDRLKYDFSLRDEYLSKLL